MVLVVILLFLACVVLQQFQLWKIRKSFRLVSDVAVKFLEDHPDEQRRPSKSYRR